MDAVFDAQFRTMRAALSARGVDVDIAFTPDGEVDYIYQVGRLLTVDSPENVDRIEGVLGGVRRARDNEIPGLAEYSLEDIPGLTVPEALDFFDAQETDRLRANGLDEDARQLVTEVGLLHITRICPAGEPEVPPGTAPTPWPPLRDNGAGAGVLIGISDTGLLENLDTTGQYPWLAGVTGDPDLLPPPSFLGVQRIPQYCGHGTFIAGVARSVAPAADVIVNDHMTASGGELETEFCRKLIQLLTSGTPPQVLSLSAGVYKRRDRPSLSFANLWNDHLSNMPEVTLVAAAGNDARDRKLWPAAFPWCTGVGSLGADEQHRAWFSNFGSWVDVYAPGEGMINAYATGTYTYQEPPKAPAEQNFNGMARWDGTSYSTPFVAGLIAAQIASTGQSASDAAQSVLAAAATTTPIPGLSRVLRRDDLP